MKIENREKEVLDKLTHWAENLSLIRAMLLESSRAVPHTIIDILSDYDVILVVSSLSPFISNDIWISDFGTPLVRLNDSGDEDGFPTINRLVLYDDGTKIDYILWTADLLDHLKEKSKLTEGLDLGYQVLIDKDELTKGLPKPTHKAYIPEKPTEEEFHALIEEFFWESTYVAKNIWRGELIQEKYNFDFVMKFELLRRLLEWRIEVDHNWAIRPGGGVGKGLKKYLSPKVWSELETTYVGAGAEENWVALFKTIDLFRETAIQIGQALGYAYPWDLDNRVGDYLQQVRQLPR